jgi:hypothetical protein
MILNKCPETRVPARLLVRGAVVGSCRVLGVAGMGRLEDTKSMAKTLARGADKYVLYQRSVQDADHEVRMFSRVYRDAYQHPPRTLREDFCGTALVGAQWVRRNPTHEAWCLDLDPEPLRWGAKTQRQSLTPTQQERLHLVKADVRSVNQGPPVDVVAAENFSFYVFKTRALLGEYFRAAHQNLKKHGVLVLDMFGGPLTEVDHSEERRRMRGFTYVWQQTGFDPIHREARFAIHFRFKDGSVIRRAFTYDWRMWTIPEVRELLLETGFRHVAVYWSETEIRAHQPIQYRKRTRAASDRAWLAYVVGVK